jgi:hypothetical protein
MIMVGQERRLSRPLAISRRERGAIAGFAGLLLVGCVVAVVVYANRGSAGTRCVTAAVASYTGGVSLRQCGAKAAAWCREAYAASAEDVVARAVRTACRRSGYPPPSVTG